jgi:hypothetical protein
MIGGETMQLFEQLILGEASPSQKPSPMVKTQPKEEEPPDFTQREPDPDPTDQQLASPGEEQQPEENPGANEVPPEEGGGEEVPPEEEQPPAEEPAPNDMMATGEPSDAEELDQAEGEIFKDIKPAQMNIKIEELKQQFKKFNSVIIASMEKLDDVSHTTYDDALLEFIGRKLLELKEYSRDYLLKTFNTRTYIQNQIELQRMIVTFNLVTNLISEIRQSRIKRKNAIEEKNNKLFKIKEKPAPLFSRGIEEA